MPRRRQPLRGSPNEHAERAQRFFRRAVDRYDRAQRQTDCTERLEGLFEAHGYLSRAYESFDSGGELLTSSKVVREMGNLSSKIRTAVGGFTCVRSRAAR